jgi:hypothetical protein
VTFYNCIRGVGGTAGRISVGTPPILPELIRGFPQSFQVNTGKEPVLGHDHFLPNHFQFIIHLSSSQGLAIAQAVSRWLTTAAAPVWSYGICGGQSGTGAGFLRVLRFPLPIFIPPVSPQSPSSIIWGWYNGPEVAAVPSGLSPTPLTIIKKYIYIYISSSYPTLYTPDTDRVVKWHTRPQQSVKMLRLCGVESDIMG